MNCRYCGQPSVGDHIGCQGPWDARKKTYSIPEPLIVPFPPAFTTATTPNKIEIDKLAKQRDEARALVRRFMNIHTCPDDLYRLNQDVINAIAKWEKEP